MTTLTLPGNPFPAATEHAWRERVAAVLKGADFERTLVTKTADDIAIQPLQVARRDATLVTKAQPAKPWSVMARVDHPDSAEANRMALADLEGGADALTLAFQDSRSAHGFGISAKTIAELDAALAGVRLDLIKLRLDPSLDGFDKIQKIVNLADHRKLAPQMLDIDFGLDPIGSLLRQGTAPWNWITMAPHLAATVRHLLDLGFKGPFLTVDLRPVHEAGGSEAQELGYALALASLYLRAFEAHAIPLADALKAISFVVPVDTNQFLGMAKLRALRLLMNRWQQACALRPAAITIHAETSWRMQAMPDTHVNILRNSIAAFSAGVAGADSVTVLPFTQVLGLPDDMARRLARNTSIVLQEESNLWRVADPSAGAGSIEALTADLAAAGWAAFQEIEAEGGLLVSLVVGRLQQRVATKAAALIKQVRSRKVSLTGTSEFPDLLETPPSVLPVKPIKAKGSKATVHLRVTPLPVMRLSEPFEALRVKGAAITKKAKGKAQVALVTLGARADHAARLTFTRGFFAAAGLDIVEVSETDAGRAKQPLLCLVGNDVAYAEGAAVLAKKLKTKERTLWLAGKPGELEASLTKAGISRFVAMGQDVVEVLEAALEVVA